MAHSHQQHRDKGRKRVAHVLRSGGYAAPVHKTAPGKKVGGAIGMRKGYDRGNDSGADMMAEGAKPKRRTGGKVPKVKVSIHAPQLHMHSPTPVPGGGPMAGAAPPAGAMAPPPGAGAPVLPPGGLPGRPAPFRKGGKVSLIGDDAQNDVSDYRPAHTRKNQGGSLSESYGAGSGMSRRAEYERMKRG
jgi:hypothetical protein